MGSFFIGPEQGQQHEEDSYQDGRRGREGGPEVPFVASISEERFRRCFDHLVVFLFVLRTNCVSIETGSYHNCLIYITDERASTSSVTWYQRASRARSPTRNPLAHVSASNSRSNSRSRTSLEEEPHSFPVGILSPDPVDPWTQKKKKKRRVSGRFERPFR